MGIGAKRQHKSTINDKNYTQLKLFKKALSGELPGRAISGPAQQGCGSYFLEISIRPI